MELAALSPEVVSSRKPHLQMKGLAEAVSVDVDRSLWSHARRERGAFIRVVVFEGTGS